MPGKGKKDAGGAEQELGGGVVYMENEGRTNPRSEICSGEERRLVTEGARGSEGKRAGCWGI